MQKRSWLVRTMKFLGLLATALLFVASTGLVARAEVKTVFECKKAYRATPAFRFKQVPAPSTDDAATKAEFTIVAGAADPHCGGLARPNILMFGDGSWIGHRSEAQHQRLARWIQTLERRSARLAVIELGAGTAIPTVRRASENFVQRLRGTLIRLNPREPETPPGQFGFAAGALAGIRQLNEAVQQTK